MALSGNSAALAAMCPLSWALLWKKSPGLLFAGSSHPSPASSSPLVSHYDFQKAGHSTWDLGIKVWLLGLLDSLAWEIGVLPHMAVSARPGLGVSSGN